MDKQRFDDWTMGFGFSERSRRSTLQLLFGAGLGWALGGLDEAEAKKRKKKNKKKKKKQKPLPPPPVNAFGCVDVGAGCQGNSTFCCSGICQGAAPKNGKPDTSTCVAHNSGGCTPERNLCVTNDAVASQCNTNAVCTVTTGGAPFCASQLGVSQAFNCRVCSTDAECVAQGFPPGSACVVLTGGQCVGEGDCNGVNGSIGTACLAAGAAG